MTVAFRHQLTGSSFLVEKPFTALFDEMGLGKSKQVIDAVEYLYSRKEIEVAVVVCPAAVQGVWDDPELGELVKHGGSVDYLVQRYDAKCKLEDPPTPLHWVITSYAFLRTARRLQPLLKFLKKRRYWLVVDESSFIKNRRAQQTKSVLALRMGATRCTLLNGLPVANNLMDLWSQFNVLDPAALRHRSFFQFRGRYAVMGGWQMKQVVGYRHEDELRDRLAPWVLRREKRDCLDLPDKLYTRLQVPLSPESWKMYQELREEMVTWLDSGDPAVATNAGVKVMRLAQVTSGYLGGFQDLRPAVEVGREKLDAFWDWYEAQDPNNSIIVWCRFRKEIDRLLDELELRAIPHVVVKGGQTPKQRDAALRFFHDQPGTILVGQPQAGGWGLNLTQAFNVVYMSNDYNLTTRAQSEDRAHRSGQTHNVTYLDVLATSPQGKQTVDHAILKKLLAKEDLARWTVERWRAFIKEEV